MSRFSDSMRMSTRSELLSGVTLLSASLVMRAVALVSPVGLFRDLLGVLSVMVLLGGVVVITVGVTHVVVRKAESLDPPMTNETTLAIGAVIGVAVGVSIGAAYGRILPVAIGTAIGAGSGMATASWWRERDQRPHTD